MSLSIEFNWHGLQKQLMEFGYKHCKISVVGAHTDFDWDALTDEVIFKLEEMHENGESLIYEFSPFWAKDGNPKIFVPDDDVWSLKKYEVWYYLLPSTMRITSQDCSPELEGTFARFEKALAAAAALFRKNYFEITIDKLSDEGSVVDSYEQEEWTEHCWHSQLVSASADGLTSDGLIEMKVPRLRSWQRDALMEIEAKGEES